MAKVDLESVAAVARLLAFALSLLTLAIPSQAHAGILGLEFNADDCTEKYIDNMRWNKQRNLLRDICSFKHGDNSKLEKRFAKCVLDSIFEVSDDSNGRRVLQSCSSKTDDQASFRRFVGRFPLQPESSKIIYQKPDQPEPPRPQPITIIVNGTPKPCIRIGEIINCP